MSSEPTLSFKRALVTGARGTVGAALVRALERAGAHVTCWDRQAVGLDDYAQMEAFVAQVKPEVIFHLAIASTPTGRPGESWHVNVHWTHELAWIARQHHARFIFASTAMVFTDELPGPYTPQTTPNATQGYGYEKLMAEQVCLKQHPSPIIARLGWQISSLHAPTLGNTMFAHLKARYEQSPDGRIQASASWLPACSFLEDTVDALIRLADPLVAPSGIYLIDSNKRGVTFAALAEALAARFEQPWRIEPTEDYIHDQRMLDERVELATLNERLIELQP